jgi:hypothetical protein
MAWAAQGGGASNDATAGTSIATPYSPVAGQVCVVAIAKDNAATTNGNTNEITSVADDKGNNYSPVREFCNSRGAANGGATISVWYCVLTNTNVAATLTANFSDSRTASAIAFNFFTFGAGSTVSVFANATDSAVTNSTVASMSIASLASQEYLFWRASAIETNAVDTNNAHDTTGWSANGALRSATTGGGAAANMAVHCELRIATATGATSAPTWTDTGDNASVMVALLEVVAAAGGPTMGFPFIGAWGGQSPASSVTTAAVFAD